MFRSVACVLLAVALLYGFAPLGAAFSEPPQDIYQHRIDDPPGVDQNAQRCQLLAEDPSGTNPPAPCDFLHFDIGNTDTHVYFRWTLSSLTFGPLGQQARVLLSQAFTGSDDEAGGFRFCIMLAPDATWQVYQSTAGTASCNTTTGLEGQIDGRILADEGIAEFSIPFTYLGDHLSSGVVPGEWFNLNTLETFVNNAYNENAQNPWSSIYARSDQGSIANGNYTLRPFADFALPPDEPARIYRDITGAVTIEETFTEATTETRVYNWTMDLPSFIMNHSATPTSGNIALRIIAPDGGTQLEKALAAATEEHFDAVATGNWTIEVELESFIGSYRFALAASQTGTPGGNGGTTNGTGDGNDTSDPDTGGKEKGLPGPAPLLIVAALAALVALRRRR